MKTFQRGRAYPIKGRELETKRNEHGRTYKFVATAVVFIDNHTVAVYGKHAEGNWCKKVFKAKTAPKWLQRCIRELQPE